MDATSFSINLRGVEELQARRLFSDHDERLATVESGTGVDSIKIMNLGTDWSAGDLLGVRVGSPPAAHKLDLRDGTAGAPTKGSVTASISLIDATSKAEREAVGAGDNPDVSTALRISVKGVAGSQTQVTSLALAATQTSAFAESGADACPLVSISKIEGEATGNSLGGYIESVRGSGVSGVALGLEFRTKNNTEEDAIYVTNAPSKNMGLWLNAESTTGKKVGAGVQIGHGFGAQFDVGFAVNKEAVASSAFRDDSKAPASLDIFGEHSVAAIRINEGSRIIKFDMGGSGAFEFAGPTGAGQFMTGTVAGDGCIFLTSGKTIHIGKSATAAAIKVKEGKELGFYGVAPVARAAAITTPAAELAPLKTAVDALREAVKKIGITE